MLLLLLFCCSYIVLSFEYITCTASHDCITGLLLCWAESLSIFFSICTNTYTSRYRVLVALLRTFVNAYAYLVRKQRRKWSRISWIGVEVVALGGREFVEMLTQTNLMFWNQWWKTGNCNWNWNTFSVPIFDFPLFEFFSFSQSFSFGFLLLNLHQILSINC